MAAVYAYPCLKQNSVQTVSHAEKAGGDVPCLKRWGIEVFTIEYLI